MKHGWMVMFSKLWDVEERPVRMHPRALREASNKESSVDDARGYRSRTQWQEAGRQRTSAEGQTSQVPGKE